MGFGIKRRIKGVIDKSIIIASEKSLESHYENVISNIRNRGSRKIRFAVYVVYDSTFGGNSIIKKMSESGSVWDPKIVIVPDIYRGKDFTLKTYLKTKEYMVSEYGEDMVLDGWNMADVYYDYTNDFDVIYYCNPYDDLVHKYHSIRHASSNQVLPIYVTYGYDISSFYTYERLRSIAINSLWRCYTDTVFSYQDYLKHETRKGRNVKLIGYSKMDLLKDSLESTPPSERKNILITPHHTVNDRYLPLSNFLSYSDLILKLPELFADVDFVFRPHPLMFVNLVNNGIWTEDDVESYIKMLKGKGIIYSSGGSYFDLFAKADAIINDSGSFTIEWLFTGKPGCFVKNPNLSESQLTNLMKKAISKYSIAKSEADIIAFVEKIANNDCSTGEYVMDEWVKTNIAVNYPHVSEELLIDLESSLV